MREKLPLLLAVLGALLLLGSFPARNFWGNGVCDVFRMAGFLAMAVATLLRARK